MFDASSDLSNTSLFFNIHFAYMHNTPYQLSAHLSQLCIEFQLMFEALVRNPIKHSACHHKKNGTEIIK